MILNLLKKSSFITLPSLYLLYLYKRDVVLAKEDERPTLLPVELKQIDPHLIKRLVENERSQIRRLPNVPIINLRRSKQECINMVETFRMIQNAPGAACAVSYRGEEIWSFGNGMADLETRAPCTSDSVMRIASISKAITMFMLGKLLEQGKLDLDRPISQYLPADKFPEKYFNKQKVDITLRHLVSHLGGIRHYKNNIPGDEFSSKEYYLDEQFEDVYDSLKLFKDDDLIGKPGSTYRYSTHGFTLISAVIQSVLEKEQKFETELIKLLRTELNMRTTILDTNETIVPNRAKYYQKSKANKLINVREVNNSYKWAGGGLLSDVHDLLKYANAMLYSFKTPNGVLKQETMRLFWSPNEKTYANFIGDIPARYGMGWLVSDESNILAMDPTKTVLKKVAYHTGAAVGVSSILVILPEEEICIALMINLGRCPDIGELAMDIAKSVYQNLDDICAIN